MWVGRDGRDGGLGSPQGHSLLCLPTTHSSAPSVHSALPPPLYLGFQCSKMHYSRCVCHRAGVGWDELMHFVFCIVFFFFFFHFCILNDTKIMCVRELGTMITMCSLSFIFPFYAGS